MLTPEQINNLPPDTRKEYLKTALLLDEKKREKDIRENFLSFVKYMWPEFIEGDHHKIMSDKFNRVANGELKRVIINMAPRHTKSEFASNFLPAWMIGKQPNLKIIQATNNAELAVRFGRKAKSLIDTAEYQQIFNTRLREDSQAAGKWETEQGGEYYAAGVGGSITGRGADLLIIDDPHSEQDALSTTAYDNTYEWYTSGPRQRLQPGGTIIIVQTRWSKKDLTGRLLQAQAKDSMADQWEIVEFPAILPNDKILWPEFWNKDELLKVKASLSPMKWNAQWQQNPTSEETAMIKREWWTPWEERDVPKLDYIIQSYDTAYSKKETADYSAITTWGVFYPEEAGGPPALILLDSQKDRWDFPELKEVALDQYKYWEPDTVIIEAKATGLPLTHELRNMGIPVVNFTPSKGNDKVTRVHSVSVLFEAGMVYAPDTKFADEMIEEVAAFPNGEYDDLVDSMTQALMRYRQGNFVQLPTDDWDEDDNNVQVRAYY